VRLRYRPTDKATLTLSAGQSADLSDNYKDAAFAGFFDTHRDQASLQGDFSVGAAQLTFGLDWLRDRVDSDAGYTLAGNPVDQRISRAAYGQWRQEFGAHTLQASLRRDDDDQFGGKTTGNAMWGWNFTQSLRLTASYGTAYKAPTFNELYYPLYGDPDLDPETSESVELGLRGKHGWGEWSVNVYETRIEDLIGYDPTPRPPALPFGGANNIDRARIRGLELTAQTTLAGWNIAGNLGLLDPRDDGGADSGHYLPRRARQTARLDADRSFGAFSVGASVTAVGERYDNPANTTRLGGYTTFDLRAGYDLTKAWSLQLNVDNAFDKDYETAAYYNQPGLTYLLGIRYRPSP